MTKMRKRHIVLLFGLLAATVIVMTVYQYEKYKNLNCGGDWMYWVKCPFGTFCKDIFTDDYMGGSGGFCRPYLLPL